MADSLTEKSNPKLPNEILCRLLGYMSVEQLLAWRSLGKDWNDFTCYHLRQKGCSVNFLSKMQEYSDNSSEERIPDFVETVEGRIVSPFPFTAFDFYFSEDAESTSDVILYPTLSTIERFTRAVGIHAKSYSIHSEHFYEADPNEILERLLQNSPNLEQLKVYGQNSEGKTFVTFPSSLVLPKLKSLDVMPYSPRVGWIPTDSDHDGTGKVSVSQFSSWITQTPELESLHSGFGVQIYTEIEAKNFLKSLEPFYQVELELQTEDTLLLLALSDKPLDSLHTLILDIEESRELIISVLESVCGSLKRLNLKLNGALNEIPCLPQLDTLELDFAEEEAEDPIELVLRGPLHQAQFPKLKSLILKSYQSREYDRVNEDWSLFQDSVFDTVVHLELIDYHRSKSEPWDDIFPNVRRSEKHLNEPLAHWRGEFVKDEQLAGVKYKREFIMRQLDIGATYTNVSNQIVLRHQFSYED